MLESPDSSRAGDTPRRRRARTAVVSTEEIALESETSQSTPNSSGLLSPGHTPSSSEAADAADSAGDRPRRGRRARGEADSVGEARASHGSTGPSSVSSSARRDRRGHDDQAVPRPEPVPTQSAALEADAGTTTPRLRPGGRRASSVAVDSRGFIVSAPSSAPPEAQPSGVEPLSPTASGSGRHNDATPRRGRRAQDHGVTNAPTTTTDHGAAAAVETAAVETVPVESVPVESVPVEAAAVGAAAGQRPQSSLSRRQRREREASQVASTNTVPLDISVVLANARTGDEPTPAADAIAGDIVAAAESTFALPHDHLKPSTVAIRSRRSHRAATAGRSESKPAGDDTAAAGQAEYIGRSRARGRRGSSAPIDAGIEVPAAVTEAEAEATAAPAPATVEADSDRDTTGPVAAVVETTVPDITVPETTVPETTVPENTDTFEVLLGGAAFSEAEPAASEPAVSEPASTTSATTHEPATAADTREGSASLAAPSSPEATDFADDKTAPVPIVARVAAARAASSDAVESLAPAERATPAPRPRPRRTRGVDPQSLVAGTTTTTAAIPVAIPRNHRPIRRTFPNAAIAPQPSTARIAWRRHKPLRRGLMIGFVMAVAWGMVMSLAIPSFGTATANDFASVQAPDDVADSQLMSVSAGPALSASRDDYYAAGAPGSFYSTTNVTVSKEAQALAVQLMAAVAEGRLKGSVPDHIPEIQWLAQGIAMPDCGIDIRILQVMVLALRNFDTVAVSDINRKCTNQIEGGGTSSSHYTDGGGHAVDFYLMNGASVPGADSNTIKFINVLDPIMPPGTRVGQSECRAAAGINLQLHNMVEFSDSCTHMHVDVGAATGGLSEIVK